MAIEILLSNAVTAAGLSFDLDIPDEAEELISVSPGNRVLGSRLYHRWSNGTMKVVLLDPEGRAGIPVGTGPVACIRVRVGDTVGKGEYPLQLSRAELVSSGPRPPVRELIISQDWLVVSEHILSLEPLEAYPGDSLSVPVLLSGPPVVSGLQVDISWHSDGLAYHGTRVTPGTSGIEAYAAMVDERTVRLVAADLSGEGHLSRSGEPIAYLDLGVAPGLHQKEIEITLRGARLAELPGTPIPVAARDGRIQILPRPNRPPEIALPDTVWAIEDQAFEWAVPVSDPDGDSVAFHFGRLPDWIAADSTSGVLNGCPLDADVGIRKIEVGGSDGMAAVSDTICLAIRNVSPAIEGSPASTGRVGAMYRYDPEVTNLDGGTVVALVGQDGLSVDSQSGSLRWRPQTEGSYDIMLVAEDENGGRGTQSVRVSVTARPNIVISEILADPPSGLTGDANRDGVRDSKQDEFVEILNLGERDVDIGGWSLSDDDVREDRRFRFPTGVILCVGGRAVLFGGGTPGDLPGQVFVDDGSIGNGLTNGGDTVILIDPASADTLAFFIYGSLGANGQSMVRRDDKGYVLHGKFPGKDAFSPGVPRPVAHRLQLILPEAATVGEAASIHLLAQFSDGTTDEIQGIVRWEYDPSRLEFLDETHITGLRPGPAEIKAEAEGLRDSCTIDVIQEAGPVPEIKGTPPTRARIGLPFQYLPDVRHLADGGLTLTTGPAEVVFESRTGSILWVPEEAGVFQFVMVASNISGSSSQEFSVTVTARPELRIVEILADPPPGESGDANRDGIRDSKEDEFVEILNEGLGTVVLAGISLSDDDVPERSRFRFPAGAALEPGERAVLFGGGNPKEIGSRVFVDDGSLGNGLTNSGDAVLLIDLEFLDTLSVARYTADGDLNESLVRLGENWVAHSAAFGWGPSSPGTGGEPIAAVDDGDQEPLLPQATQDEVSAAQGWPRPSGLLIQEVLPDPGPGMSGDTNGDGVREGYGDEFVELRNTGPDTAYVGGWYLGDADVQLGKLFQFPSGTALPPGTILTLFGGGVPTGIPGLVFTDDGRIGDGLSNAGGDVILISADGRDTLLAVSYVGSRPGISWVTGGSTEPSLHQELPGKDPCSPGKPRAVLSGLSLKEDSLLVKVGEAVVVEVWGQFSDGADLSLAGPIPFVSTDTAIVCVDEVGQVRAVRPGSTRIRASWGDVTSSETVVIVGEAADPSGISRPGPAHGSGSDAAAGNPDGQGQGPVDAPRDTAVAEGSTEGDPQEAQVPDNLQPLWRSTPDTMALASLQYRYRDLAHDPEGGAVSYQLTAGPRWLQLHHGALSGTPGQKDAGLAKVVVTASDGVIESAQSFTLKTIDVGRALDDLDTLAYSGLAWRAPLPIPFPFTVQVEGGPHLELATQALSWRPEPTTRGRRRIDLAISANGSDELLAEFWLHVLPPPRIRITEILVDPTIDANGDGRVSHYEDQFVELQNMDSVRVDLGGWRIESGGDTFRMPDGVIVAPGDVVVVFGRIDEGHCPPWGINAGGRIAGGLSSDGRLAVATPGGADTLLRVTCVATERGASVVPRDGSGDVWIPHPDTGGLPISPGRSPPDPLARESIPLPILDEADEPIWVDTTCCSTDADIQAFPTPFNSSTRISFRAEGGAASLSVYSITGQLVWRRHLGYLAPGEHQETWNGVDGHGRRAGTGTYLIRVVEGNRSLATRVLLMR